MKRIFYLGFFFLMHFFWAQDNNRILEPALESLNLGVDREQTHYAILKSINHYPQTVKAYVALGRFYFQEQKYVEALFNFFQAHQNDPQGTTPQAYLADFYMRCGLLEQASPYLDFCLKAETIPNITRDPLDLKMRVQLWQAQREILQNQCESARNRLIQLLKEKDVWKSSSPMEGDAYRLLAQIAQKEKNETETTHFQELSEKSKTFLTPVASPFGKTQIHFQYVNSYHAYGSFLYEPVMRWAQINPDGSLSVPLGKIHFSSGVLVQSDQSYQIESKSDQKQVEIWFVSKDGISSNKAVVQIGQGVSEIRFSRLLSKQTRVPPNGRADFHITATNSLGQTYFKDTFYWWAHKDGQEVTRKVLHRTRSFSPNTFENHRITFFAPKKEEGDSWAGVYQIFVSDQPQEEKSVVASAEVFVDFSQPNFDKLLVEHPGGIDWERTSFEESSAKAQREQKPMFVLATAAWCPFCRRFEKGTLQKDDVIQASRKFVCAIVDIERQRELVQRWDIKNVPALIFLTPDGLAMKVLNYQTYKPEMYQKTFFDYLFNIESYLEKMTQELNAVQKKHEKKPNSDAAKTDLAEFYLQKQDFKRSLEIYQGLVTAYPNYESFYLPRVIYLLFKNYQLELAIEKASLFIEKYPKDTQASWVLFYQLMCYFHLEDYPKAQEIANRILQHYPKSGVEAQVAQMLKMLTE